MSIDLLAAKGRSCRKTVGVYCHTSLLTLLSNQSQGVAASFSFAHPSCTLAHPIGHRMPQAEACDYEFATFFDLHRFREIPFHSSSRNRQNYLHK
jgi:hypothetical protein